MDDVKSLFFPTEISMRTRRPMTQQIRANRSSLDQTEQPYDRLRKTKQEMRQAKKIYFQTLSATHKIELSLNQLERRKQLTRAQFLKLYGNAKYKRFLADLSEDKKNQNRQFSQERKKSIKKKKLEMDLERMLIKNQEEEKIANLQKRNKKQKQKFLETKYSKQNQISSRARKQHDQIKNHNTEFLIRKSHISSALQQRSKHNYFKKVNQQLSMLRDYESVVSEINNLKFSDIGKLIRDEGQIDKKYQSFFMTTKNTLG